MITFADVAGKLLRVGLLALSMTLSIGLPLLVYKCVTNHTAPTEAAISTTTDVKMTAIRSHRVTRRTPDGAIVTSVDTTSVVTATDTHREAVVTPIKSKYRLGAGIELRPFDAYPLAITDRYLQFDKRIYDTPIWLDTRINTKRELTLGLSIEF